jgi:hypothetical protein
MTRKNSSNKPPARASTTPRRSPRKAPQPAPAQAPASLAREAAPEDLPDEVLEFVRAIDAYKRAQRRQFPSWSEVLEILKQLGYERRAG